MQRYIILVTSLKNVTYLNQNVYCNDFFVLSLLTIEQACQTQTSLRAAKATKTAKGAPKVLKNSLVGYI